MTKVQKCASVSLVVFGILQSCSGGSKSTAALPVVVGSPGVSPSVAPGSTPVPEMPVKGTAPEVFKEGPGTLPTPTLLDLPTIPSAAASARHVCAVTETGGVKCKGINNTYQLGQESTTVADWIAVPNLSGVHSVVASAGGNCALTRLGGVKCWGLAYVAGTDGSVMPKSVIDAPGLTSGVKALVHGQTHYCALTTVGKVWCWGINTAGQTGQAIAVENTNQLVPREVTDLGADVASIASGRTVTCALKSDKSVWCWGLFDNGVVSMPAGRPTKIDGLTEISSLAVGEFHACALNNSGAVWCWGQNVFRQLGTVPANNFEIAPKPVSGLEPGVKGIAASGTSTCVLTATGGVKCFGYNQLYRNELSQVAINVQPVDITDLNKDVTALRMGMANVCGKLSSGSIKCAGSRSSVGSNVYITDDLIDMYAVEVQF